MAKITFIGLGNMGKPMASNLAPIPELYVSYEPAQKLKVEAGNLLFEGDLDPGDVITIRASDVGEDDLGERAADRLLPLDPEAVVEGVVAGDDAQLVVEHQQRPPDVVDDAFAT